MLSQPGRQVLNLRQLAFRQGQGPVFQELTIAFRNADLDARGMSKTNWWARAACNRQGS